MIVNPFPSDRSPCISTDSLLQDIYPSTCKIFVRQKSLAYGKVLCLKQWSKQSCLSAPAITYGKSTSQRTQQPAPQNQWSGRALHRLWTSPSETKRDKTLSGRFQRNAFSYLTSATYPSYAPFSRDFDLWQETEPVKNTGEAVLSYCQMTVGKDEEGKAVVKNRIVFNKVLVWNLTVLIKSFTWLSSSRATPSLLQKTNLTFC